MTLGISGQLRRKPILNYSFIGNCLLLLGKSAFWFCRLTQPSPVKSTEKVLVGVSPAACHQQQWDSLEELYREGGSDPLLNVLPANSFRSHKISYDPCSTKNKYITAVNFFVLKSIIETDHNGLA